MCCSDASPMQSLYRVMNATKLLPEAQSNPAHINDGMKLLHLAHCCALPA